MTASERVQKALARAEERRELGAFWVLDDERALTAAEELDERGLGNAAPGALAGSPVAIKDMFDQAGLPTTGGLQGQDSPAAADADAVRLLREAGAIPIGKTAMDPLGCTTGGQAPGFPPCLNPIDARLSPGGSSSGSAVAVAAGIVPLGLGTDTAGSVRIPAAYCGIVGFKPVRDAVPRGGCIPVMPSFDTPGVLADSVDRCVVGLRALGEEVQLPPEEAVLRVGVLDDLMEEAEEDVASACSEALEGLGDETRIEVTRLGWRPAGFGLALAYELAQSWGEQVDRDPGRFTDLIRATVAFGRRADSAEYGAVLERFAAARGRLAARLGGLDAVICPTTPTPAPPREDESVKVSSRFTRIFNALDWPAVSIPAPVRAGRAPVGLQVAGLPSRVGSVVEVARRVEAVSGGGVR